MFYGKSMKQEIAQSAVDIEASCCSQPRFDTPESVSLTPKLHQARGYITYTCVECGAESQRDYYLSHKEVEGEVLDKNATEIPAPEGVASCEHVFFTDQMAVLTESEFRVESACGKCGVVVYDIFKRM